MTKLLQITGMSLLDNYFFYFICEIVVILVYHHHVSMYLNFALLGKYLLANINQFNMIYDKYDRILSDKFQLLMLCAVAYVMEMSAAHTNSVNIQR